MRTGAARIAVIWCIAIGLLTVTPAAQAADPFFGMFTTNLDRPAAQLDADLDAHARTGVGLLREHVYWDRIERAPGVFDFNGAEVVLGGLSLRALLPGGFLEQLYDRGAATFFDTLALHPYGENVGTVVLHIQRARAIATAKNDANVPLRVTEYGFATGGASGWTTTPACQAALIAATTRELSARRAEFLLRGIIQLQWQDRAGPPNPWPNFTGLVNVDGSPKPALAAFTDAVAGRPAASGTSVAEVCPPQYRG